MARTAEVEHYPEGRDWRCTGGFVFSLPGEEPHRAECDFSKPESEGKAPGTPGSGCPNCGGPLSRIATRTVHRPKAEARRFT